MVGIRRRRFGSDDGVAVMGGASLRCGNMVYRNTYHIIWYNITIWYGNIAILYCTQLAINYCRLAEDFFLLGNRSPAERYTLFFKTRPSDPPKNATAAQPLSACYVENFSSMNSPLTCFSSSRISHNALTA